MPKLVMFLLLNLFVCLQGCAARPNVDVLDTVPAHASSRLITAYVATTRGLDDETPPQFTDSRSLSVTYARYVISIPPSHKANAIEWPKGKADAAKSFAVIEKHLLTRQQFSDEIVKREAMNTKSAIPNTAVFVHGYNYSFQESLFRLAQMASDSNLDGTPILFAWPSEATVSGYIADKDAAMFSRDGLCDLLSIVAAANKGGKTIVFGHSMGAWLTLEAFASFGFPARARSSAD